MRSNLLCPFRRPGLCLTLVLHLAVWAWPATGFVLCKADDGHVTIEMPHEGADCFGDYRRHHPEPLLVEHRDLDRHGCTDSALGAGGGHLPTVRNACGGALDGYTLVGTASSGLPAPRAIGRVSHLCGRSLPVSRPFHTTILQI